MKLLKRFIIIICFAFIFSTTIISTTNLGVQTVEAATIKLSKSKATMMVGDKLTLVLKNAPASKVKWTTSNKKIATVKAGEVTAKKTGTVTITAQYGNKKYICKIKVDLSAVDMAALGCILLKDQLKDPNSFTINSVKIGYSDFQYTQSIPHNDSLNDEDWYFYDDYELVTYENVRNIIIDFNSKNSYGGSVRKYLQVFIFPKEGEPNDWIQYKSISNTSYLTIGTYSSKQTLSNSTKVKVSDVETRIKELEEEDSYEIIYN